MTLRQKVEGYIRNVIKIYIIYGSIIEVTYAGQFGRTSPTLDL